MISALLLSVALQQTVLGPGGFACPAGQAVQVITGTREKGKCVSISGTIGSVAPVDAPYVTTASNATLTNEKVLPTCTGTDKLTFNGTTISCAADQNGASGDDAKTVISAGTCNGATLFTLTYVADTKFHFRGWLQVGSPNNVAVSCARSVSSGGYPGTMTLHSWGASSTSGGTTTVTAPNVKAAGLSAGTSSITGDAIAAGGAASTGAIYFEGSFYSTGASTGGTFTCTCTATGGSIAAGSYVRTNTDN